MDNMKDFENSEEYKILKKFDTLIDGLVDLMAVTGDSMGLFLKSHKELSNKLTLILHTVNIKNIISEEQMKQFTSMFNQFNEIIDDFVKENKIELR